MSVFKRSILGSALVLSACVSSHVMVGKARPPISPQDVQVYFQPPPKFEQIAILDTSSRASLSFSAQGKTDKVIERLKEQAAKLGANGVLIQSIGDRASGSVGIGFGAASAGSGVGVGTSSASYQKAGNGVAIYVAPN
ncbi:MAG TPA: hypothetical protein VHZ99_13310 [Steroidobacteraceae bacterium]|nr:hypothetical protein [Steroidobacteraceae bacterium]